MMPAEINSTSRCPVRFIPNPLDISAMDISRKDAVTDPTIVSDIHECLQQMNIMTDYQIKNENGANICESDLCSAKREKDLLDYVQLGACDSQPSPDGFMCLGKTKQFSDNFELNVSNRKSSYSKKSLPELNKYSPKQLQVIIEDLTQTVEQVSSELVELLLENDALQQETDARNIAIEQLLKMTVKLNESELKPIQMSIILPDDDCDDV